MYWIDSGLTLIHFLATNAQDKLQSPPDLITPQNSSVDIQLLTQQINFLKDANSELHTTFSSFATTINITVIVIGVLLTTIGAFLTASTFYLNRIYNNTVKELKEDAKNRLNRTQANLESNLSFATDKKLEQIKRTFKQEEAVNNSEVIYINTKVSEPLEFRILSKRGFDRLSFSNNIKQQDFSKKIVVLDLVNLGLDEEQELSATDEIINKAIKEIEESFPRDSLLVLYCRPSIPRITQLLKANKIRYVTMANNRISLVGAVVDSAYILDTVPI